MKTTLARILLLAGAGLVPALAGNQVLLSLLNPADGTPQAIAADSSGHLFVVSTLLSAAGQQYTRVVELDLNGNRLASLDLAQMESPAAAATDAQGNLILAGAGANYQGLVLKLDGQLKGTLFSMSLPAAVYAVAVDASGNVYVTGSTGSTTFPVTAGAYQTKPPVQDPFVGTSSVYAFLTEIAPDGSKLLYSTYFGGDGTNCFGGSACVGAYGWTVGTAIVLDPSGGVVIAGNTDANDLPTTPGALAGGCACQYKTFAGFIARFQPGAAQQLQWSTFLNAYVAEYYSVSINGLALDAAGNVLVGGSGPGAVPTTPGTIQPSPVGVTGTATSAGFLIELNRTGTAVIWGTYFGGSPFSGVKAIDVDAQGRVLFTGVTVDPAEALSPTTGFRSSYVARMTSDAATLIDYYEGPYGLVGQGMAIASTGGFAAVGQSGGLWIETTAGGPSLLAVANSAGGASLTTVAPHELISLYGVGIGPATPLNGQVVNGVFTTSLGGYQVLFDGVAAPLLYATAGQINAVVPARVGSDATTTIQIVTPTGTVDGPTAFVAMTEPAVFSNSQTGLAAALNQDGSVNSPANPAYPGSIVTVFAAGAGYDYFGDGEVVPIGIYSASEPVLAVCGLLSLETDFAGSAPGLVAGVMQIDFRVPDPLPSAGTLFFSFIIGGVATGSSQIAVTP
jgi:uncharacterized protein (TIGR03437 family)